MKKIRILVADGHDVVRQGMVTMLSLQPDMEVVGEAKDGIQTVELAKKLKPDVTILELLMPRQDGITTIASLKVSVPNTRILILTILADDDNVHKAIKAGALGYMLKDSTRNQILQAIRDIANGQASI